MEEQGCTSVTSAVHYQVIHTWRIKCFESYFMTPKCHMNSIYSSVFGHEDDPGTRWALQLFPNGDKEASTNTTSGSETLSFFINLDKSSDQLEMHAKYSVSIIGGDRCVQKVTGENMFKRGSGWGRSKFMKLDDLLREKAVYMPDDAITVRCSVEYTKPVTTHMNNDRTGSTTATKITNSEASSPGSVLSQPSLIQMPWHDVILSVCGVEIAVHRKILSASSHLLAELVSGEETTVRVDGVDSDAFYQMIRFIYTNECDLATEGNAYKLLVVASKYRLISLLSKCEDYLLSILDKSNCYVIYSWADMSCCTHLKNEAIKVIENLCSSPLVSASVSGLTNAGKLSCNALSPV